MANNNNDLERTERRAKRELRRQKQRKENVSRAKKMHTARMMVSDLIFTRNLDLPTINIGCSGWFYWHWQGKFYPEICLPQTGSVITAKILKL